jgi:hypothetical protein
MEWERGDKVRKRKRTSSFDVGFSNVTKCCIKSAGFHQHGGLSQQDRVGSCLLSPFLCSCMLPSFLLLGYPTYLPTYLVTSISLSSIHPSPPSPPSPPLSSLLPRSSDNEASTTSGMANPRPIPASDIMNELAHNPTQLAHREASSSRGQLIVKPHLASFHPPSLHLLTSMTGHSPKHQPHHWSTTIHSPASQLE